MSEESKSYKQIIKSTGIFGGSQAISILIGILRNKILAILLGTVGIGLISIYQNILDLIKSFSSFGLETTGVREIASVEKVSGSVRLAETISLIDRMSLIFASIGAIVCLLFSYPISLWAFDDSTYTLNICLLSVCVFFSILAAGQMVVLHGLRQITYMVKSTLIWSLAGLVLSVPLYYFLREDGIIPAFIIVSIVIYIVTYYYRRKIAIQTVPVSLRAILKKGISVFRVGFFIVLSSVVTIAGFFLVRTFLNRDLGLNSVGLFQAAWSITNVYLMLILKSMGADFYPRLCSVIRENNKSVKLINEQTYIVLIVSVPLIIVLFLSSKLILSLLYSSQFTDAASVLNWQVFGTFFKVVSWPLGFILLAKGKGALFFLSEMTFLGVYLGFIYVLYPLYNFDAIGISYLIAYIVYLLVVYLLGRKLCRFEWTGDNKRIGFISLILVLLAFYVSQYCPEYSIIAGIPIFGISLIYSLIKLNKVFPVKSLLDLFKKK